MKPAVRLSALMGLPVKFIWTHDAFRVGEDGPTHQPVEQEAQIRLLEHLKNHKGQMSLLALRPADAAETSVAWKMALENTRTPTALLFSRQNIKDVPAKAGSTRYQDALQAEKGAYVALDCNGMPDVVLVASGSEVSTLIGGAELLTAQEGSQGARGLGHLGRPVPPADAGIPGERASGSSADLWLNRRACR